MSRKVFAWVGLLLLSITGCAAVVATAAVGAGILYISGEASKNYVGSVDDTHAATVKAMTTDMGLAVLKETRDGDGWYLMSRRPGDAETVEVRIAPNGENLTQVKVRVGVLGDKDYSTKLLEAINKYL